MFGDTQNRKITGTKKTWQLPKAGWLWQPPSTPSYWQVSSDTRSTHLRQRTGIKWFHEKSFTRLGHEELLLNVFINLMTNNEDTLGWYRKCLSVKMTNKKTKYHCANFKNHTATIINICISNHSFLLLKFSRYCWDRKQWLLLAWSESFQYSLAPSMHPSGDILHQPSTHSQFTSVYLGNFVTWGHSTIF